MYTIRVKFDQINRRAVVLRFRWNKAKTRLLSKQYLNSVGKWVKAGEAQPYQWDAVEVVTIAIGMENDPVYASAFASDFVPPG